MSICTSLSHPIPTECPRLNELPLTDEDWDSLRSEYTACRGGTHDYAAFVRGVAPSFRLAAQIDLDRFHGDEEHLLDWPTLFAGYVA